MRLFLIIFTALSMLLTSACMSNKRVNRLVKSHYVKRGVHLLEPSGRYVKQNFDSLGTTNRYSYCKNRNFIFIPVIFYAYVHQKKICELNPIILSRAVAVEFAGSALREDLRGRFEKYEIQLIYRQVPTHFYVDYSGHQISPLTQLFPFSINIEKEIFHGEDNRLVLDFKIVDRVTSTILKSGTIDKMLLLNNFKRGSLDHRKDVFDDFLSSYDEKLYGLSHEIMTIITTQIELI